MVKIINEEITEVAERFKKEKHKVIIAHQVNCQGAIGAGVSGAIIKKYPYVRDSYLSICHKTSPHHLLGKSQSVVVDEHVIVVNIFAQLSYGNGPAKGKKFTNEGELIRNLRLIEKYGKDKGYKMIAPFKIGSGLANGDWSKIFEGISDLDIVLVKL